MSTPPNPRNACQRLLLNSLGSASVDGASLLSDVLILIEADASLSPQWSVSIKDDVPLWKSILTCLGQAQERNKIPVRSRSVQEALFRIFSRDGLDMSVSGPVMLHALSLGLPWMIMSHDQSVGLSAGEVDQLKDYDFIFPSPSLVTIGKAWSSHSVLSEVHQHWSNLSKNWEWMSDDMTHTKMSALRYGKSWTAQEADRYMLNRVLPQWLSSNRTPQSLRFATGAGYSKDNTRLIQHVSHQAWKEVLYSKLPNLSASIILANAHSMMFGQKSPDFTLDLPVPPTHWFKELIRVYDTREGREVLKQGEHAHTLRQFGSLVLEDQMSRPGLDWNTVGLALHSHYMAFSSLSPPNRVVDWVAQQLAINPTLPPVRDQSLPPIRRAMMLSLWVREVGRDDFVNMLSEWEKSHPFLNRAEVEETQVYHGCVANGLYLRFVRGKDDPQVWPKLASVFWSHFLRADIKAVRGLLPKVMRPTPAERPDIFSIDGTNSKLKELLDETSELPRMSNAEQDSGLRRCMLSLKAAVSGTAVSNRSSGPRM